MIEQPEVRAEVRADPARDVWLRVRTLVGSVDVIEADHHFMREVGLTAGPVRVLRALLDGGPQSMRLLADRLGCDKSYVTVLVKPLIASGFATLEQDPSDGRVKIVTPTEVGDHVARRAREVFETPPAALRNLDEGVLLQIQSLLPTADASAR